MKTSQGSVCFVLGVLVGIEASDGIWVKYQAMALWPVFPIRYTTIEEELGSLLSMTIPNLPQISHLIGGFNPSEKSISFIGNLPLIGLNIKKGVWNHKLVIIHNHIIIHPGAGFPFFSLHFHKSLGWLHLPTSRSVALALPNGPNGPNGLHHACEKFCYQVCEGLQVSFGVHGFWWVDRLGWLSGKWW